VTPTFKDVSEWDYTVDTIDNHNYTKGFTQPMLLSCISDRLCFTSYIFVYDQLKDW